MDLQLKIWETNKKNIYNELVHSKVLGFIFKIGVLTTVLASASLAI